MVKPKTPVRDVMPLRQPVIVGLCIPMRAECRFSFLMTIYGCFSMYKTADLVIPNSKAWTLRRIIVERNLSLKIIPHNKKDSKLQ